MLYFVTGNTFIFSGGTVVQQEDGTIGGDILLYVLDPADVTIDPGY
jgi:lipopolysaccharide export system protein LptA